jgi:hypothetical protein
MLDQLFRLLQRTFSKTNSITVDWKNLLYREFGERKTLKSSINTKLVSLQLLKESFSQFAEDKIMDLAMKDQGLKSKEEVLKKGFVVSEPSDH